MSSYPEALFLPIYIADAFTDRPFAGNPAAICLVPPGQVVTENGMQSIGAEMNLSETAFITLEKGNFETADTFGLRWFTPTTEVNLCGHATLASAAVLFFKKGNRNEKINFHSRSGILTVTRNGDKIVLNFPSNPPVPQALEEFQKLLEVVIGDASLVSEVQLSTTTSKLLVRLHDHVTRKQLEKLTPDISKMMESEPNKQVKGVGITVKGSKENGCVDSKGNAYDFVSRYFAPWLGIPEDPVTGSWHTVAACYWSKQLKKQELYARQCSSRGGSLWLALDGERINISGNAVVNMQGVLSL